MMARAVAVWVALGTACTLLQGGIAAEGTGRRRFPDDEVTASQSYFSRSWRDHFNKGDFVFCGASFLENASMHAALGPTASDLKKLLGLEDPAVIRGRGPITDFWNSSFSKAGLRDLRAYEEQGDYKSNTFVVDDNTVIKEGHFAFSAVRGQIFSEMWIRQGEEWKLRSMMLAFQELQPGAKLGTNETATEKQRNSTRKEEKGNSSLAKSGNHKFFAWKSEDTSNTEKTTGSSTGAFWLVVILLALVVAGIMVRRKNKRKEAGIAGFEVMLG